MRRVPRPRAMRNMRAIRDGVTEHKEGSGEGLRAVAMAVVRKGPEDIAPVKPRAKQREEGRNAHDEVP